MEKLSIKIKICDRIYPMKVPKNDEELLRKAAKKINDKIFEYNSKFGTNDNQDLLSIVCFDSFVELMKLQENFKKQIANLNSKVNNIQYLIDNYKE